jgi:hypothetical protein
MDNESPPQEPRKKRVGFGSGEHRQLLFADRVGNLNKEVACCCIQIRHGE